MWSDSLDEVSVTQCLMKNLNPLLRINRSFIKCRESVKRYIDFFPPFLLLSLKVLVHVCFCPDLVRRYLKNVHVVEQICHH